MTKEKADLDRQLDRLRTYAVAKGYSILKEVKEIASGLNDNRPKLAKLLAHTSIQIIVVEHKDRLTRFGFNYKSPLAATATSPAATSRTFTGTSQINKGKAQIKTGVTS